MTQVKKKVYVHTYGCQMNVYDSSKMVDVLREAEQMEQTDAPENADVILLNTCSIREKAQEKVFSDLGRWKKLKHKNPELVIGVGGCVASQEGEDIVKRAPYVDMVFGPQTLHRLPQMYDKVRQQHKAVVDITFPEIEKFDRLPEPRAEGPSAFVSIMEGCSKYCTYCIVPYTRGAEISRPFDDVLAEIATLAEQGVKEITLLGQNVNDYLGPMHDGGTADLALLIHYMAALDGIERIRYTTSHPTAFSDNLIEAYAEVPELANHLHLPVQSGSDRILAMMKRNYTAAHFRERIARLRAVRPDIPVSSDFIVGFPTETDADFEDTMNLVHDIGFDHSYSFIYSPRPGTPAAKLKDNIDMDTKKRRLKILQDRLNQQTAEISQKMVGTTQTILITGESKKDAKQISGRTENNRVVNLDGDKNLIGQMVKVKITEALPNSLRGDIEDITESAA
ncbi:MAG: tRNA (N6-isopentenyl adenosine(37)-C2)-methylthiotransferase MiaB [Legionellales bacterium]|nr:tRNA (N6-isopentenyl adenosine(37)-C2)-methylthiotransferase MiaB [Legionellales bacterium]|tara:strand:- start:75023 stop:76375 length:1353 start_codon:yes stop_codon:yes gene_type:complete